MLANLGTPESCEVEPYPDEESEDFIGGVTVCAAESMGEALPPALLASTGASLLLGGIIAYVLAPSEPRPARQAPVEKLRGERWTRLRDERNRGRSGR